MRNADLRNADLSGADLRNADLRNADLSGATGLTVPAVSDLALLFAQPGPIRAYKVVTSAGRSPVSGAGRGWRALEYKIGQRVECDGEPNRDPAESCGAGLHVATPRWVVDYLRSSRYDFDGGRIRVLVVEFNRDDLAAIPFSSEGKFRVKGCTPIAEVSRDELVAWLGETPAKVEEVAP